MIREIELIKDDFYYNFKPINNGSDFFNTVSDIACILFTFYEDIPNQFYFYKDNQNYLVKSVSNDQNLFSVFKKRLPDLYENFIKSLSYINKDEQKAINIMVSELYINQKIIFNREVTQNTIISKSNIFSISRMKFKDINLHINVFKYKNINNDSTFSQIQNKIGIFLETIKEYPNKYNKNKIIDIIKFLNGRSPQAYFFEIEYGFSWAWYIISTGNTRWLHELRDIINPHIPLLKNINPILIGLLKNDVNIIGFYLYHGFNVNSIIQEPYKDILSISPNYVNYLINQSVDVSLLSLCVLLNSFEAFLFLIESGADINLKSEKLQETPMFFAVRVLSSKFINVLLDYKADLNIENLNKNIASEVIPPSGDDLFNFLEKIRKNKAS